MLVKHCISCHGSMKGDGGLRLDSPTAIRKGGASGDSLISTDLKSNELYQRVTSTDESTRMPLRKPKLDSAEIEKFKAWIQQGCPLPQEVGPNSEPLPASTLDRILSSWEWLQAKTYRLQFALIFGAIALLSVLAWVARIKKQRGTDLPWADRLLSKFSWEKSIVSMLVTVLAFTLIRSGELEDEWKVKVQRLEAAVESQQKEVLNRYGAVLPGITGVSQVEPFRYLHPKGVSRTYYRGNCERDVGLFNGGNYLTARLKLSLRTADGKELKSGDELPQEGVVIHFAIERGPGTADSFYDDKKMGSIFLEQAAAAKSENVVFLKATKPGWIWEADFPIKSVGEAKRELSGVISVYRKTSDDPNLTVGEKHYTLHYEIQTREGKIDPESDLWCGCTFVVSKIQLPPADGYIPFNEWFDWRPIPEIAGENSKDPVLLGLTPVPSESSPAPPPQPEGEAGSQGKP